MSETQEKMSNKDLQKSIYENFVNFKIDEKTYVAQRHINQLGEHVLNRKLDNNKRLTKEKLNLIKKYLQDVAAGTVTDWDAAYPLQAIFKPAEVDALLKRLEPKEITTNSLLPIKGISKVMQARLAKSAGVYDVGSLIAKGKLRATRNKWSIDLGVDVKLVNLWVKQANLWRVKNMTADMAYLLVLAGIRHEHDLSLCDVDKLYPVLQALCCSQTDLAISNKDVLKNMIDSASDLCNVTIDIIAIKDKLGKMLGSDQKEVLDELKLNALTGRLQRRSNKLAVPRNQTPVSISSDDIINIINSSLKSNSNEMETDDPAPEHLYKDGAIEEPEIDLKASSDVIESGLEFLRNVVYTLPLPRTISGFVYRRRMNERDSDKVPFANAKVEVMGVTSAADDKAELPEYPSAYTDSMGRFMVVMPERYNLQEVVTVKISEGAHSVKFVKAASDIIEAVPEQQELAKFNKLNELGQLIDSLGKTVANEDAQSETRLQFDAYTGQYNDLKSELTKKYTTADVSKAYKLFEERFGALNAMLEGCDTDKDKNEGFVVINEILMGESADQAKALPKVKLMGNGEDDVVRLSTDTAPSRIYSYGMLQRLVEPRMSVADKNGKFGNADRVVLNTPVDVDQFRRTMTENPNDCPQMSSLGIGYVLNMHQAWVPDGFALGSLLYSLVLAPGEEQRLVVRENKQDYTVLDDNLATDSVDEQSEQTQDDDTDAAFRYAVDKMSDASSSYRYQTKTASAGASGGIGSGSAMLGLSGGYSSASGSASVQFL